MSLAASARDRPGTDRLRYLRTRRFPANFRRELHIGTVLVDHYGDNRIFTDVSKDKSESGRQGDLHSKRRPRLRTHSSQQTPAFINSCYDAERCQAHGEQDARPPFWLKLQSPLNLQSHLAGNHWTVSYQVVAPPAAAKAALATAPPVALTSRRAALSAVLLSGACSAGLGNLQRAKHAHLRAAWAVQACRWLPWTRPARRSPSPRRRAPPATRAASAPPAHPHTRWKVRCSACCCSEKGKHCTPADRLMRRPGMFRDQEARAVRRAAQEAAGCRAAPAPARARRQVMANSPPAQHCCASAPETQHPVLLHSEC